MIIFESGWSENKWTAFQQHRRLPASSSGMSRDSSWTKCQSLLGKKQLSRWRWSTISGALSLDCSQERFWTGAIIILVGRTFDYSYYFGYINSTAPIGLWSLVKEHWNAQELSLPGIQSSECQGGPGTHGLSQAHSGSHCNGVPRARQALQSTV